MSPGTNINRLRMKCGMSQDALAEKLGVSRQSVSKWETDGAVPELEKLVWLAELFGVSLDEMVRDIRDTDKGQKMQEKFKKVSQRSVSKRICSKNTDGLQSSEENDIFNTGRDGGIHCICGIYVEDVSGGK